MKALRESVQHSFSFHADPFGLSKSICILDESAQMTCGPHSNKALIYARSAIAEQTTPGFATVQ